MRNLGEGRINCDICHCGPSTDACGSLQVLYQRVDTANRIEPISTSVSLVVSKSRQAAAMAAAGMHCVVCSGQASSAAAIAVQAITTHEL